MNNIDNAILSKADSFGNLIAYQNGSVVSRTLMKMSNGTVTLFAFDEGEGLSEHTAPYDALVFVSDGNCEITISANPNILSAGDMIIMPAGEPHAVKALSKFKMMLVMIKKSEPVTLG